MTTAGESSSPGSAARQPAWRAQRPVPPPGTQPPPAHGTGGWRSLVISMLLIGAVVLAWLALSPSPDRVPREAVDVDASARSVAGQTSWPLLVADPGPGWTATYVRFGNRAGVPTWEAGYVRDGDDSVYVSVAQTGAFASGAPSAAWLSELTRGGGQDGTARVAGSEWTAYTAPGDSPRRALVPPRGATPLAVVVSGLGDQGNLVTVAASLQPWRSAAPASTGTAQVR